MCSRTGCKNRVKERRRHFCSPECSQSCRRTDTHLTYEAAERLIEGTESREDKLARENVTLTAELREAHRLLGKYQEKATLDDRLVETVTSLIQTNPYRPRLAFPTMKAKKAGDHEFVLLLSDAHYGEVVDPQASLGITYDPVVFEKRLEYIVKKTLRYLELRSSAYHVRKLTVAQIGDMLSGEIHAELSNTNALATPEALVKLAYLLHDAYSKLASHFDELEVVVMCGNHTRLTMKPPSKEKWANFEYILGALLKALAGDAYKVTVPKDLVYIHDVFDFRVALNHGDGMKVSNYGGLPFYGFKSKTDALQSMLRQLDLDAVDILCIGHYHVPAEMQIGSTSFVANGSIIGPNEFSMNSYYSAAEAVQLLLTIHERHGLADVSRISLGHIQ